MRVVSLPSTDIFDARMRRTAKSARCSSNVAARVAVEAGIADYSEIRRAEGRLSA
ncbi:hypothetical protein ACNKHO_15490 [Shigella flexneri]